MFCTVTKTNITIDEPLPSKHDVIHTRMLFVLSGYAQAQSNQKIMDNTFVMFEVAVWLIHFKCVTPQYTCNIIVNYIAPHTVFCGNISYHLRQQYRVCLVKIYPLRNDWLFNNRWCMYSLNSVDGHGRYYIYLNIPYLTAAHWYPVET